MPATTAISRVGRFEFFSIMTPGFHILVVLVFLAHGFGDQGHATTAWQRLEPLVETVSANWPLAIVLLFSTYLLGSIPRAMSVSRLDEGWPKRIGRIFAKRETWTRRLYDDEFPYRGALQLTLNALKENKIAEGQSISREGTSHTMFNFWKMVLCCNASEAFAYLQNLEERVRLFAGMIRAGVFGLLGTIALLIACVFSAETRNVWLVPTAGLCAISLVMIVTFSRYLRPLRGWEVNHVFLAYVAHRAHPTVNTPQIDH
jgi:hypothetical protein